MMTKQVLDWKKLLVPGLGPMREERQYIALRIEVCAFDRYGRFFSEVTETSDLSESGCRCSLRTEIAHDSVLAIRMLNDGKGGMQPSHSVLFRAVRMEKTSSGWAVAAEKLQRCESWIPNLSAIKNPRNSRFD